MNQKARRSKREYISLAFDIPTILKDLKKVIWIIFCLSVPVSLLSYVAESKKYVPQYAADASYAVTTRGNNNSKLASIELGSKIADRYAKLITSDVVKKKVTEDTGIPAYEFTITSECSEKNNIFKIKVISNSPYKTFRVIRSVMKNYTTITDYFPDETYIRVLTEPVIPVNSFTMSPSKTIIIRNLIFIFGGLAALFAGLSCLRDTVRFGTDVEDKLSVPFIGAVNYDQKRKGILNRLKKSAHQQNKRYLVYQPEADAAFIESVHKVTRKIRFMMAEKNAKTLLITSIEKGEEKSKTAANIALALADQGKSVVLVDLDLKSPELYRIFQIPDLYECCLKEYLDNDNQEIEHVIGTIPETGLDAVLNRETVEQSSEVLSGGRIKALIDYLRGKYEYVIIDTSPMSVSSDTEKIAGVVDSALMVIKVHESTAKKINDELDIIYQCQTEIIGCILNGTHNSIDSYIGGAGYMKYCFEFKPLKFRRKKTSS